MSEEVENKVEPGKVEQSLKSFLVGVWLFALFATLYCAGDIRGWLMKNQSFSASTTARKSTEILLNVSQVLGFQWLNRSVRGLITQDAAPQRFLAKNKWYTIQKAKEPAPRKRKKLAALTPKRNKPSVRQKVVRTKPPALRCKGISPPPKGHRWDKSPRKILLVGASTIHHFLGIELERMLERYKGVEVHRLGKVSSGLSRPDFFDWQGKIKELIEKVRPELTITLLGRNDTQAITSKDRKLYLTLGTRAWRREYKRRHAQFVSSMRARGGKVIVLGNPVMRSPILNRWMRLFNVLIKASVIPAGAHYIPLWMMAATPKGEYRTQVTFEGVTGLMRMADGSHFSMLGSKYMAEKLSKLLAGQLQLLKKGQKQDFFKYSFLSKALGRRVSYLAYLPKTAVGSTKKRFPVLYLLHGAGDNWRAWSEHSHQALRALADKHQLIIVTPDGNYDSWYLDSPIQPKSAYATYLIKELLPDVQQHLPANCQRGIAGLSMGGHGAITLSLKYPGLFTAASSMSGVLALASSGLPRSIAKKLGARKTFPKRWKRHSALWLFANRKKEQPLPKLYFSIGRSDRLRHINRKVHRYLKRQKIPHEYHESPGAHSWRYWTQQLPLHVAWMAKQLQKK